MLGNLAIIDASACVYTGMASAYHKDRSYYGYPVGGLHYLFRYVTTNLTKRSDVIVVFDSRSFRKDLLDCYKAGRSHNKLVHSQLEMAYKYLSEVNIACYKVDGYEADDIIYWAVKKFAKNYYGVEIFGNDKDLLHNVQSRVSFHSISSNVNSVYLSNFEKSIEKGKTIPFNTISAYKVFCGCSSDKIPQMKLSNGMHGEEIYNEYLKFLREKGINAVWNIITDSRLPNIFGNLSGLFTEEERIELYNRVRVVYPAECPDDVDIVVSNNNSIYKNVLEWTLNLFNDWESIKCMKFNKINVDKDDIKILKENAQLLTSGAYEIDKNSKCEFNYLDSFAEESIFLKDV